MIRSLPPYRSISCACCYSFQTGDPAIHSRAMKYLRGEDLSDHDRKRLCGVTPLTGENEAVEMICRLGTVMARMQQASLVICVDQDIFRAYDEGRMSAMRDMFRRAVVTLRTISDHLPGSIIVISCLEDYYDHFREALDRTQLDRIEHNSPTINLVAHRTRDEIELLARRHLAQLLDADDGDLESHWSGGAGGAASIGSPESAATIRPAAMQRSRKSLQA